MIRQAKDFVQEELWRIPSHQLPLRKSMLIIQLRILILTLRGFVRDQCQLRASALTFYTLLSIVPVMAMAFGLAKGFGLEQLLQTQLTERFAGHEAILARVLDFSHTLLESTRGGMIAGVGVFILFWSVIKLLGNIESSFNEIWGVKAGRSLGRKFSDYLAITLVCPLLLIVAGSTTVFVATSLTWLTEYFEFSGPLRAVIHVAVRMMPFGVIGLLFTFLFMFMPNTRVRFRAALSAGILAGIIYQLVQWGYIAAQVGLSKYNAIYGSFAALPFFLVWVQFSWLIVLFGAELTSAIQRVDRSEFEPDSERVSPGFRFRLTLLVLTRLVGDFDQGHPPATVRDLHRQLGIPIPLLQRILFDGNRCGLLREAKPDSDGEPAYLPATDSAKYTVAFVAETLLRHGGSEVPVLAGPELGQLSASLQALAESLANSPANLRLKDLGKL